MNKFVPIAVVIAITSGPSAAQSNPSPPINATPEQAKQFIENMVDQYGAHQCDLPLTVNEKAKKSHIFQRQIFS